MPERTASLPPGEPDPALLEKLAVLQQACLLVTALMALIVFAGWLLPSFCGISARNSLTRMSIPMALVVLLCALSLAISEPRNHLSLPRASRYIAAQAGLLSILILLESTFRLFPAVDALLEADRAPGNTGRLPVHSPAAFVVLSVSMVLVTMTGPLLRRIADGLVPVMCLVTLILLSENLFGAIGLLRLSANNMISPLLLMCLVAADVCCGDEAGRTRRLVHLCGSRHWKPHRARFRTGAAGHSLPHRSRTLTHHSECTWCRNNTERRF